MREAFCRWRRPVLAAGIALCLTACNSGASAPSPSPAHGARVTIATGVNPAGVAVGNGYAWVANSGEGTVSKIDLRTNRPVAKVTVGDPHGLAGCETGSIHQTPHGDFKIRSCDLPKAVAAAKGVVWAGRGDTQSLIRIDPMSNRVVASIPVGIEPWYMAASDTAVWMTDWRTSAVVRVDPATNRVIATIANLPAGPTGIAIAPGGVWVASSRANTLTRIDPATNLVANTVATDLTPLPVLYAYGSVWVRNEFREGNGTVQRIDPTTDQVVATIAVGPDIGRDGLDGLAALDGAVWVAGLSLERIDPATNTVTQPIKHTANAVTAGAGSLWTVDVAYSVSRITP
jgi:DNA-binding beta-propeller fold protein YncE